MTTGTLIAHPGEKIWNEFAQRVYSLAEEHPIASGELHILVTPLTYDAVWHWCATQLSRSERVPVPVTPDQLDKMEAREGITTKRIPEKELYGEQKNSVPWRNAASPTAPFTIPVSIPHHKRFNARITLHKADPKRSRYLCKDFPDTYDMADHEYVVGWISPYDPHVMDKKNDDPSKVSYTAQKSNIVIDQVGSFSSEWLVDAERWMERSE